MELYNPPTSHYINWLRTIYFIIGSINSYSSGTYLLFIHILICQCHMPNKDSVHNCYVKSISASVCEVSVILPQRSNLKVVRSGTLPHAPHDPMSVSDALITKTCIFRQPRCVISWLKWDSRIATSLHLGHHVV